MCFCFDKSSWFPDSSSNVWNHNYKGGVHHCAKIKWMLCWVWKIMPGHSPCLQEDSFFIWGRYRIVQIAIECTAAIKCVNLSLSGQFQENEKKIKEMKINHMIYLTLPTGVLSIYVLYNGKGYSDKILITNTWNFSTICTH